LRASTRIRTALLVSLSLAYGATARADQEVGETTAPLAERPRLRAGALPPDFRLDGHLSEPAWRAATDSIADLVMVEPDEGEVPTARTVVKILVDQDALVIGVRCDDPEPSGIVSFSKARDSDLSDEDNLSIVFDPFLDGRSGYVFATNPDGARFDGLIGDFINRDWDAIWEAETSRDERGWSAEIRIPVKSLSFKKDATSWGFNLERYVARLQEVSRWSGANLNYAVTQVSRAGLLTDLPNFNLGVGLSIRPAVVGRLRGQPEKPGPGIDTDLDADVSLDVTQKLGTSLQASLTVNTDFAETEVDVRQINLTRFPIFFPEKRTFFLEGADIFEFGLGLAPEENLLPFHSRRIGLLGLDEEELTEIPINAGGKLNGRLGATNLSGLVVNTREQIGLQITDEVKVDVPQSTMGAMRVSQNVLEESKFGVLASFGDQQGRSGSWSAGADFTFQTSTFRGEKNLEAGVWGLVNDRDGLHGDKSAFGFRVDYPNDVLDTNFTTIRIGDAFDPSLGFVPRKNVQLWDLGIEVNPRPKLSWLRQMFYEFSFSMFNRADNKDWESYSLTFKPFDWLLESGDRFDFGLEAEGDRPPKPFEVSADVDLAPGEYEWSRWFVGARTAERRRLSAELRGSFGVYYTGDLITLEGRITAKPSALWAVEVTGERSVGEALALVDDFESLPAYAFVEKRYLEELYGVRLLLNVSSDLQFSSLTQYDIQSRELGTNNRLRWTFDPLGELFIVYNHNLNRVNQRWLFVSNELPVKIQYALRF